MIDSEQVPWGKGEKQPGEGDEIVSETICLQTSRSPRVSQENTWMTAFLLKNEPTSLFYVVCLFNPDREKAKWKRGLIGRITAWIRPETGWANHDQGEPDVTIRGGPNPLAVQHKGMSCG